MERGLYVKKVYGDKGWHWVWSVKRIAIGSLDFLTYINGEHLYIGSAVEAEANKAGQEIIGSILDVHFKIEM